MEINRAASSLSMLNAFSALTGVYIYGAWYPKKNSTTASVYSTNIGFLNKEKSSILPVGGVKQQQDRVVCSSTDIGLLVTVDIKPFCVMVDPYDITGLSVMSLSVSSGVWLGVSRGR